MAFTESVGAATINGLAYVGGLARITGGAAKALFVEPGRVGKLLSRSIHQAMAVGVEAIPIVSLISFFVGIDFCACKAPISFANLGALQFVAAAVAIAITRELGPLMTAIMVIGRSGSSFAAEIGTMKVNEEIDAMETMALEPVRFLVAPKLLAMMLMLPCLTTWADFMGVVGGGVFGVTSGPFTWHSYFQATLDALVRRDILTGLVKSVMFGVVITAVGCHGRIFDRPRFRTGGPLHNFGGR